MLAPVPPPLPPCGSAPPVIPGSVPPVLPGPVDVLNAGDSSSRQGVPPVTRRRPRWRSVAFLLLVGHKPTDAELAPPPPPSFDEPPAE